MIKSPTLEDENIIKDVKNLFRFEKPKREAIYTPIKDIRNLLRREKKKNATKDIILSNVRDRLENPEETYYKLGREIKFWGNSYNEYKSNCERHETLSVEEYLNKIRLYLKSIINNLKISGLWKIQSAIHG